MFNTSAVDLGAIAIKETLKQVELDAELVEEELARAISFANIPDEISDELILKIKKKESKNKIAKINNENLGGLSVLKKATDKDGNLTKSFLDKYLSDEGLIESSSEHLIGQAEVQGLLIRVDENTWNWLS